MYGSPDQGYNPDYKPENDQLSEAAPVPLSGVASPEQLSREALIAFCTCEDCE